MQTFEQPANLNIRQVHPRALTIYGSLFGIVMIAGAVLWNLLVGKQKFNEWFPGTGLPVDLVWGAAAGIVFALAAWRLQDFIPAFQGVTEALLASLDMPALTYRHALLLGLIAGIPEEILLRGALQPTFGLVLTSVLFGALHGITRTYFLYATTAGLVLGALAIWSGGLWAPIAAHTLIDLVLFVLLIRSWRTGKARPIM